MQGSGRIIQAKPNRWIFQSFVYHCTTEHYIHLKETLVFSSNSKSLRFLCPSAF